YHLRGAALGAQDGVILLLFGIFLGVIVPVGARVRGPHGGDCTFLVALTDLQADRAIKFSPEFFQVHDVVWPNEGRNACSGQSSHPAPGLIDILRPPEVDQPLIIGRLGRWRRRRLKLEPESETSLRNDGL